MSHNNILVYLFTKNEKNETKTCLSRDICIKIPIIKINMYKNNETLLVRLIFASSVKTLRALQKRRIFNKRTTYKKLKNA